MENERSCRRDLIVGGEKKQAFYFRAPWTTPHGKMLHPNSWRGLKVKSVICLQLPGEPQASEWVPVVF